MTGEFERIEREILQDMIARRDLLNKGIASLEDELAHPRPNLNWEQIEADVKAEISWIREHIPSLLDRTPRWG